MLYGGKKTEMIYLVLKKNIECDYGKHIADTLSSGIAQKPFYDISFA